MRNSLTLPLMLAIRYESRETFMDCYATFSNKASVASDVGERYFRNSMDLSCISMIHE